MVVQLFRVDISLKMVQSGIVLSRMLKANCNIVSKNEQILYLNSEISKIRF